jgi:hypothetical protein
MLADLDFLSQPSDRFLLPPRLLQSQHHSHGSQQLRTSFSRVSDGPGLRNQQQHRRAAADDGRRSSSSRDAAAGSGGGSSRAQVQPRPYFYRIQRTVANGLGSRGTAWSLGSLAMHAANRASDPALSARRAVYEEDMWALPLHDSSSAADGSAGSRGSARPAAAQQPAAGSQQERWLHEWVDRELRALLQEEDVAIVRAFVVGLVRSFGVQQDWSIAAAAGAGASDGAQQCAAGQQRGQPQASTPAAALQPFLFDHSEHFWHELRMFCLAGLPKAQYDAAVVYASRAQGQGQQQEEEQQQQEVQRHHGAAAGHSSGAAGSRRPEASGSGRRRSRWDELPAAVQPGGSASIEDRRQGRRRRGRSRSRDASGSSAGRRQHDVIIIDSSPEPAAAAGAAPAATAPSAPAAAAAAGGVPVARLQPVEPLHAQGLGAGARSAPMPAARAAAAGSRLKRAGLEAARRLQALQAL